MKTRIISGIAMVPFAALVYFGGLLFWLGVSLLSLVGIKEFYDAFKKGTADTAYPIRPHYWLGMGVLVWWSILPILWFHILPMLHKIHILESHTFTFGTGSAAVGWVTPVVFLFLFHLLFRGGDMQQEAFLIRLGLRTKKQVSGEVVYKTDRANIVVTLLGLLYVAGFFGYLVRIDQLSAGYHVLIWLVFITAFGTDVMAYFTGYFLGKHKLCPKISPKKTIEGSVGGILGSALLCGLFGWIVRPDLFIHCMVIGFVGSIFAQMGDLTASVFKRKLGIKDYGNLIPGHGGVLDRFDSVLFTAPLVYYYIVLLIA